MITKGIASVGFVVTEMKWLSKYIKLAQKEYSSRHDSMRMGIRIELCKTLEFEHAIRSYLHKLGSILEN